MADIDIEALARADTNLLVALEALMQERSVTRAAKRLAVSQSAMSHTLGRLRAWFDDELFVRSGQTMTPTPLALRLREPVRSALEQVSRVIETLQPFQPSELRAAFRVGAFDLAQVTLFPRVVAILGERAPGVQLLGQPYPEDAERALADGSVDLVIGLLREPHGEHQRILSEERFASVVRRDHPCLDDVMTLERFAAMRHTVVSPIGRPGGFVDSILAERGLSRRVVLTTPHLFSAALAVCRTDTILTAAARPLRHLAEVLPLTFVETPAELPPFHVAMTWHERRADDAAHRFVRELFTSAAADDGDAGGGLEHV